MLERDIIKHLLILSAVSCKTFVTGMKMMGLWTQRALHKLHLITENLITIMMGQYLTSNMHELIILMVISGQNLIMLRDRQRRFGGMRTLFYTTDHTQIKITMYLNVFTLH